MKYIAVIFILMAVAVYVISLLEYRKLKLTRYEIESGGKLPAPVKFVFISDMHCCFANAENIINKIAYEKPDAIILAGDMVICSAKKEKEIFDMADFINRMSEIADVYYGMGNHEREMEENNELTSLWNRYVSKLNLGVKLLENKSEELNIRGSRITICGLDIPAKYYEKFTGDKLGREDMNSLIGEKDRLAYIVLIAHNPDFFHAYMDWQADLVLSGHNHGGLLRLPVLGGIISPKPRIFPKYDYGIYENNNTKMIVSNGVGGHSVMVRVNNVPELIIINLK
ncbi:MAG: metallophosphoesterase [Lachnospiraceae bacterium]|nr:metallophosphoesterase [Lachnospiraceae bacterium]